jgi:cellulose synthase/poly-beta-1,6-N-acetylglucosamine synthase-like glycosyltransferase
VYVGYPALLALWARLRPRSHQIDPQYLPSVSIVVAARNEARRLPGRIENLLAVDYPAERLEIIVVSNGSADRTAQAIAPYLGATGRARPRVRLIELEAAGKATALNAGVAAARHDVLLFADARQRFARETVRQLVNNLADPTVGAVSGELVLDCELGSTTSTIGDGVGAYWRYEKFIRKLESRIDSTIGATGAVYAMRRTLWRELPPGTLLDDVLAPMRVVLAGSRVVFDERARAFDVTPPNAAIEVQRKTRTLAGNYQLAALEPRLLVPFANRVWLQFWSHKLGRLLVPYALVALFVASAVLAPGRPFYMAMTAAQVLFYALALYGERLDRLESSGSVTAETRSENSARRRAVNA